MRLRNNLKSYGFIAKSFHWLMAILIIGLLVLGLVMASMENTPDKFKLIGLHKEFGLVVLVLAVLRLGWKIIDVSPLLPDSVTGLAKLGAKMVHSLLYILMFAMPLTGWLMSSAAGFPVSMFGLFLMPNLVSPDKNFGHDMNELHEILAWVLIALIALHIFAALLHHFYYRDNILLRMLPRVCSKSLLSLAASTDFTSFRCSRTKRTLRYGSSKTGTLAGALAQFRTHSKLRRNNDVKN